MQSFESKMDLIKDSCRSLKLLGSKVARLLFPRSDPRSKLASLTICSNSTIICEREQHITHAVSTLSIPYGKTCLLGCLEISEA